MRLVIDTQRTIGFRISILLLLLSLILCRFLPEELGWENSLLENGQIVVLSAGVFTGFFWGAKLPKGVRSVGYLSAAVFLFFIARELSWGRVFLLKEYTEHGPTFMSMKALPYHNVVEVGIGVYVLLLVLGIIFLLPWKKLFSLPLPLYSIILMVLCFVISRIGEVYPEVLFMNHPQGQVLEEAVELFLHVLLIKFVWDYCRKLRFEFSGSSLNSPKEELGTEE